MRKPSPFQIFSFALLSFFILIVLVPWVSAKVGVGMGAGEIRINEPIRLGGIYEISTVRIFNTGDERATYGMNIAYHQDHLELRPEKGWFSFSPSTFTLEGGESQEVRVTMTVPLRGEPGDYFAFIESGPVPTNAPGTSVGIAVATKLYFTLVPANLFQAIQFRIASFYEAYSPWPWVGTGVAVVGLLGLVLRRFFSFNISIRK